MMVASNINQIAVAVYARKSTDARLEQEVNSITVQRASGKSFIQSQQHLGWYCMEEEFSDNNVSGATLERPALRRLMKQIEIGEVQVVVVNRLDRISRSLSQFLDLMAFFEEHDVAMVSVTQNINTGDAMGRLMLQIIMSFAEFERELIRDRVTERMHAARKQGRFIGGCPPLGYTIKQSGGELEIDELEAMRVRKIFERYLELRSIKAEVLELHNRNWCNKKWVTRQGKICGGSEFSVGTLHRLLTNPIYIGKVTLKGEEFEGQHEGIVDSEVFAQVQVQLAANSVQKGNRQRNAHNALLKGLLRCKACNKPFVHTYTRKKSRMYRYYTCSNKRLNGAHACPSPSIPAGEIESLVTEQLFHIGTDPNLQKMVHRQLVDSLERKGSELAQQQKTAKRQLSRIDKELDTSRKFEAPLSLIRHLEDKRKEALKLLENASSSDEGHAPTQQEIAAILCDMKGLWPSFNTGEKCAFIKILIREVEYDAIDGNITLHFNDEALVAGGVK